jgi:hypothetical protein
MKQEIVGVGIASVSVVILGAFIPTWGIVVVAIMLALMCLALSVVEYDDFVDAEYCCRSCYSAGE